MRTYDKQQKRPSISRRRFFAWIGWSSFVAFFSTVAVASARFLFPRVLYEPSPRFVAGKPEDYEIGEVSTRFKKAQRVWMIRNSEGMYALIAICTHLGCTPIWYGSEARFKCPCHGSMFLLNGDNVAGPAPIPLYRATIALDLSNNLVVNKAQQEDRPGVRDKPPFFLPLSKGKPAIA